MSDPTVAIPALTALLGLWALLTGRGLAAWPSWPLRGRSFRLAGAYTLLMSVLVIAVALNHHAGIAFLIYAVLSLALVVTLQIVGNRRPAT